MVRAVNPVYFADCEGSYYKVWYFQLLEKCFAENDLNYY